MKQNLLKISTIICAALVLAAGCKKNKDVNVPVESVTVEAAVTIDEGTTKQLTATVLPENAADKTVKWKSDNTEVASVDQDGLVSAVKWGEATITVTTEDGGKMASCVVTVKKVKGDVTDDTDISSRFDKNFALHLKARGIVKDENSIKYSEVKGVKTLEDGQPETIYDSKVESLDGIEYFTALEKIHLDKFTGLSSIDLSWNVNLKSLRLDEGKFTSLDLSKNVNLEELYLYAGEFTALDLSKNLNLKILWIESGAVSSLDLTACTKLTKVIIDYTVLEDIKLGDCPVLAKLELAKNRLASLDLSGCPALQNVYVPNNELASLTFAKSCDNLTYVNCVANKLTALDASGFKKLETLDCRDNLLTEISVYNPIEIKNFGITGNPGKDGRFTVYNSVCTWPDRSYWLVNPTDPNSKVMIDWYCEAAPKIKTQPSDAKLTKGKACVFSVALADGSGFGLSCYWCVVNGGAISDGDRSDGTVTDAIKIRGSETAELSITLDSDAAVESIKDLRFYCVIEDTNGYATVSKTVGFITE